MAEVQLEADLPHPPERVWQALTDAQLLGEWFMPTDLQPMEGTRFTLEPGEQAGFGGPVSGELIELVPERRMVMRWRGESLHTRVAWELTETAAGCRLRLLQSGFVGAPATVRQRALRATYLRMVTEQLPEVLDQLAGGHRDPAATAPVIPRQRRPPEPDDPAVSPPARAGPAGRGWPARGREWLRVVPAWGRALVLGTAAALVVLVLLAGITQTWRPPAIPDGGSGPELERDGPGLAAQPGSDAAAITPEPRGEPEPGAPPAPEATQTGTSSASPEAGDGGGTVGEEAPATTGPDAEPPAPELTALMTTSGRLLGLSGRTVTVAVANPGPGEAASWQVTMDVGGQEVTGVTGAAYERSESLATFTPTGGQLSEGDTVEFSFDIPGSGLGGLGGATDPTDCMIDDRPCD